MRFIRTFASLLFMGTVVAGIGLLAVLNASAERPVPRQPTPATSTLPATRPPVTRAAAVPSAPNTPTPSPSPRSSPTATPEPTRTARVANTGGIGVYLRREPAPNASSITAIREGSEVEVLREEVSAARVWHLVRDPLDREGWVLAEYLEFVSPEQ